MVNWSSRFNIGSKVYVDQDRSLVGVVISVEFRRPLVVRYEVSWIVTGNPQFTVFDEWRLTEAA